MRPNVVFPMGNLFIIAMQRTALRFLTTPTETLHEIPNTVRTIAYPKQLPDYMRDAIERPVIFGVSMVKGTAFQLAEQTPALQGGEPARTPRATRLQLTLALG